MRDETLPEAPPLPQKKFAMLLSRLPRHPRPSAALEQVSTPGDVAARLLTEGWHCGDLQDRFVVDLGCGTGILSLGAAVMAAEFVTAYDIDAESLRVADTAIHSLVEAPPIAFHAADVRALTAERVLEDLRADYRAYLAAHDAEPDDDELPMRVDTVVMNPPFGADLDSRRRGGDRVFLELAFQLADVVLSIHPEVSEKFLASFSRDEGFEAAKMGRIRWDLPAMHAHHKKRVHTIDVGLYRFERVGTSRRDDGPDA